MNYTSKYNTWGHINTETIASSTNDSLEVKDMKNTYVTLEH